jgi:hypothetical protein
MAKLSKTSIQLSPETLKWLDSWPGMTRSEAIRLALDRTGYLYSLMRHVEELADKFKPILDPVLMEFSCDNYRTVARLLPDLIGSFIQEAQDNDDDGWREELTGNRLDPTELFNKVKAMPQLERIYLLDCIVARREWSNEPGLEVFGRPVDEPPADTTQDE